MFSRLLLQAIGILSSSNALRLFVGFWGTLHGQLQSFWIAPLSSVIVPLFFHTLSPWSLPGVGNGSGNRQVVTPGHHSDPGGNLGKRNGSGLPERHVQVYFHIAVRIQGIQRRGDVKDCVPRNLFPRLGVG